MASIFKKTRDKKKRNSVWYISYFDENNIRRMVKGFTDKSLTTQLAAKLENQAMLCKQGLIDPQVLKAKEQKKRPLTELLDQFLEHIVNTTDKHKALVKARILKVIEGCELKTIQQIDAEKIHAYLNRLRYSENLGHRTYNHYIQAVNSFCNWLVNTKRMVSHPIAEIPRLNEEVDTLPEAMELARHTDIKMTMKYTHIGILDQAKAVAQLPVPKSATSRQDHPAKNITATDAPLEHQSQNWQHSGSTLCCPESQQPSSQSSTRQQRTRAVHEKTSVKTEVLTLIVRLSQLVTQQTISGGGGN